MFPVYLDIFGVTWSCVLSSTTSSWHYEKIGMNRILRCCIKIVFQKQYSKLCVQMNKRHVLYVS
jgi:hypothetical protein